MSVNMSVNRHKTKCDETTTMASFFSAYNKKIIQLVCDPCDEVNQEPGSSRHGSKLGKKAQVSQVLWKHKPFPEVFWLLSGQDVRRSCDC